MAITTQLRAGLGPTLDPGGARTTEPGWIPTAEASHDTTERP
jgi:hypothetical protein